MSEPNQRRHPPRHVFAAKTAESAKEPDPLAKKPLPKILMPMIKTSNQPKLKTSNQPKLLYVQIKVQRLVFQNKVQRIVV